MYMYIAKEMCMCKPIGLPALVFSEQSEAVFLLPNFKNIVN